MSDKAGVISQGVVLLPLAHIIVCFVYLFGYSIGFGANIGIFFEVSDLFGTALHSISRVYITGLVLPLVLLIYLDKTRYMPLVGTMDFERNPDAYSKTEYRVEKYWGPGLRLVIAAIIIIEAVGLIGWLFFDGRFPSSVIQVVLLLLYVRYIHGWIEAASITPFQKGLSWLAISLPVAALVGGIAAGQTDRRERFPLLSQKSVQCEDWAVRRRVGELYLAINRDGSRSLIDEDCATKLTFPKREVFSTPEEDAAWWGGQWQRLRERFRQLMGR